MLLIPPLLSSPLLLPVYLSLCWLIIPLLKPEHTGLWWSRPLQAAVRQPWRQCIQTHRALCGAAACCGWLAGPASCCCLLALLGSVAQWMATRHECCKKLSVIKCDSDLLFYYHCVIAAAFKLHGILQYISVNKCYVNTKLSSFIPLYVLNVFAEFLNHS